MAHRQVGLADAGHSLEQHRLDAPHPGTGRHGLDPRSLDGGLKGGVEVGQGLPRRKVRQPERRLHPPRLAARALCAQQNLEELVCRHGLADRLTQQRVDLLGGVAAAERISRSLLRSMSSFGRIALIRPPPASGRRDGASAARPAHVPVAASAALSGPAAAARARATSKVRQSAPGRAPAARACAVGARR